MEITFSIDDAQVSILKRALIQYNMKAEELAAGAMRAFLNEQDKQQAEILRVAGLFKNDQPAT